MLDVRIPIGALFTVIGLMLMGWGIAFPAVTHVPTPKEAYDINLNFIWGTVILVFGACMSFFAWRGRRARSETKSKD